LLKFVNDGVEYAVNESDRAIEPKKYGVYICSVAGRKNAALLQIATASRFNTILEQAGTVLQLLQNESAEWNEKYHFDWLFPELRASFLHEDGRRVNVLCLREVDNVRELHALSHIIKSGRRVDIRTAIWILGRLLKLLMFVHPRGYSIAATAGNVLIHPGTDETKHQAAVFNWGRCKLFGGAVPMPFCQKDIAVAAKTTLRILGADDSTGEYPYEDEHGFLKYVFALTENDGDSMGVYEAYYRYVYDQFGRQFHPFTTFSRNVRM